MKLYIFIIAALAVSGFAVWLAKFVKGRRRRAIGKVAIGDGVYVEEYGPEVSLLAGTGLPFFVDGRGGFGKCLLRFLEEDGIKVYFFDYYCALGAGANEKERVTTVALFDFKNGAFPDFHVAAGGAGLEEASGLDPVDVTSFGKLPPGLKIYGRSVAALKAFLTPERAAIFAEYSGWSAQGSGRYLLLYNGYSIVRPIKYGAFMAAARKLALNMI